MAWLHRILCIKGSLGGCGLEDDSGRALPRSQMIIYTWNIASFSAVLRVPAYS